MSFFVCDDDAVKAEIWGFNKNLCRRGANLLYSYFRTKDDLTKFHMTTILENKGIR